MSGLLCLQGGGEFSVGCRDMDAHVLDRTSGPVAVLALACESGAEYGRAATNGVAHFRRLGAEAYAVPDPREGNDVRDVLEAAGLVVLPGGSPSRLLDELARTGLGDVLREHVSRGGAVLGASAGAMVLGSWTVLPEDGPRLAEGLGLAQGMVVIPHWSGERPAWLSVVREGTVLGLAEESGVIVESGQVTGVGRHATRLVREQADLSVGHTLAAP